MNYDDGLDRLLIVSLGALIRITERIPFLQYYALYMKSLGSQNFARSLV